jgi:hypothetical protein
MIMNIIQREKAPPALIGIIEDAYEGIPNIKSVVIGASMPWLVRGTNRSLGGYDPQTGVIFIDMETCARCIEWMAKGCMYIPNVWINLMYTVHHELIHACQVLDDPELMRAKYSTTPNLLQFIQLHKKKKTRPMRWHCLRYGVGLNGVV